jgi:hypothetical protein
LLLLACKALYVLALLIAQAWLGAAAQLAIMAAILGLAYSFHKLMQAASASDAAVDKPSC